MNVTETLRPPKSNSVPSGLHSLATPNVEDGRGQREVWRKEAQAQDDRPG